VLHLEVSVAKLGFG